MNLLALTLSSEYIIVFSLKYALIIIQLYHFFSIQFSFYPIPDIPCSIPPMIPCKLTASFIIIATHVHNTCVCMYMCV